MKPLPSTLSLLFPVVFLVQRYYYYYYYLMLVIHLFVVVWTRPGN